MEKKFLCMLLASTVLCCSCGEDTNKEQEKDSTVEQTIEATTVEASLVETESQETDVKESESEETFETDSETIETETEETDGHAYEEIPSDYEDYKIISIDGTSFSESQLAPFVSFINQYTYSKDRKFKSYMTTTDEYSISTSSDITEGKVEYSVDDFDHDQEPELLMISADNDQRMIFEMYEYNTSTQTVTLSATQTMDYWFTASEVLKTEVFVFGDTQKQICIYSYQAVGHIADGVFVDSNTLHYENNQFVATKNYALYGSDIDGSEEEVVEYLEEIGVTNISNDCPAFDDMPSSYCKDVTPVLQIEQYLLFDFSYDDLSEKPFYYAVLQTTGYTPVTYDK